MSNYVYKSQLRNCIESFVSQKRASGFPYQSSALILLRLDKLMLEKFPEESMLTREICNEWIHLKPGEHPNGLLRRITPVRQLGKYMNGLGYNAYIIPGHIPYRQISMKHISTQKLS